MPSKLTGPSILGGFSRQDSALSRLAAAMDAGRMEKPFDYFFNDRTNEDVGPATIEQYLRGRAQSLKLRRGDSAALSRLLAILRPDSTGVTAPPPTAIEIALGQFQPYLRQGRSLTEATVINYNPVARLFLSERFPKGAVHCQQIAAGDIAAFVQRQATLVTSKRALLVVTALRSFLRYLFNRGIVAVDLAT